MPSLSVSPSFKNGVERRHLEILVRRIAGRPAGEEQVAVTRRPALCSRRTACHRRARLHRRSRGCSRSSSRSRARRFACQLACSKWPASQNDEFDSRFFSHFALAGRNVERNDLGDPSSLRAPEPPCHRPISARHPCRTRRSSPPSAFRTSTTLCRPGHSRTARTSRSTKRSARHRWHTSTRPGCLAL